MKMKVKYDRNSPILLKYKTAGKRLKEETEIQTRFYMQDLVGMIQEVTPVDTGDLKKSYQTMHYWNHNKFYSYVYSESYYLQFLIMGTGIHNRTGKGRQPEVVTVYNPETGMYEKKLRGWFYKVEDTRSRYYGWHHTLGMEPNPFLEKMFTDQRREISNGIRKAARKAIKKSLRDY